MLSVCRPPDNQRSHSTMTAGGSNGLSPSVCQASNDLSNGQSDHHLLISGSANCEDENLRPPSPPAAVESAPTTDSSAPLESMTITVRCDVCDMLFFNPSYLRKHLVEAHGMQSALAAEEEDGIEAGREQFVSQEDEKQSVQPVVGGLSPVDERLPNVEQLFNGEHQGDELDPTARFLKAYADSVTSLLCVICGTTVSSAEHLYLHMVEQHAPDMQAKNADSAHNHITREAKKTVVCNRETPSDASSTSSAGSAPTKPAALQLQQPLPALETAVTAANFRCEICRKQFRTKRYYEAHKRKKHQHSVVSALLSGDPTAKLTNDVNGLMGAQQVQEQAGHAQQHEQIWTNLMAQNALFPQHQATMAAAAAALGAYVPLVPDMSCATCRQVMMLFQSHFLSAHAGQSQQNMAMAQYNTELANAAMAAIMQQHNSNMQPMTTPTNGMSANGGGALDLSLKPTNRDDSGSTEAFCELCHKYFCNKYFLRTHKMKIHGIVMSPDDQSPGKRKMTIKQSDNVSNGCQSPATSEHEQATKRLKLSPSPQEEGDDESVTMSGSEQPAKLTDTSSSSNLGNSNSLSCNLCVKSFPSFFALIAHRYRDHGSFDNSLAAPYMSLGAARLPPLTPTGSQHLLSIGTDDGDTVCNLCNKELTSAHQLRVHKFNAHGVLMMDRSPAAAAGFAGQSSGKSMTGRGGRTPTCGVKNFCDVCKKELCNKYFLRTHMLKMHGIVIDDYRTVIGSISMASGSTTDSPDSKVFRCNKCDAELTSTMALKMHYEKTHADKNAAEQPLQTSDDAKPSSFVNSGDDAALATSGSEHNEAEEEASSQITGVLT